MPVTESSDVEARWPSPGVAGMGTASFLADAGHEIPTALLPSLLTSTLGAPASALGAIEGVSDARAGVARFGGGDLADDPARRRRSSTRHSVRMIYGSHVILFSSDPEADRAFLADVLGFEHVDAGGGWLIFGLPPAELAVHPAEAPASELYFMCDDVTAERRRLEEEGVQCSAVDEARWGSVTKIRLPSGSEVGLYEPKHPAMVEPR